ncbi:hypothetical protein MaudMau93_004755 [Microsporum audouinii]
MFRSLLGTQSSSRSSGSSRHRHRRDRDEDDDSRSKTSSHSHHHKSSRHHSSSSKHKSSRSDDRDADKYSSSRRSSRRYEDEDDGARSVVAASEIVSEAPSRALDGERGVIGDDPDEHYRERRSRRKRYGDDDSVLDEDLRDTRRRERDTHIPEERTYRDDAPSTVGSDLRDPSRREGDTYPGERRHRGDIFSTMETDTAKRENDRYDDDDRRRYRRHEETNPHDRYEPTRSERRSRTLDDRAISDDQPTEPVIRSRTTTSGPQTSRSPLYPTDGSYPLPPTSGPGPMPQQSYYPPTSGSYPPPEDSHQPPMIGSAAEYYGDQGQSVPNQPGYTPSAVLPSHGPEYGPPPMPQYDQQEAGPSGPPQHGTGPGVMDGMAAGAAGYGMASAMAGGLPHSGPSNMSPTMPGSMPSDIPPNNAHSNVLPGNYDESPTTYAPSEYPENRPHHSSSHGGLAALGATAGLAAAAGLAANAHHNSHHNAYGNSQHISQSQHQGIGGFQQGTLAYHKRHHGPLRKFVDFWRDPEGVALYEEYSEITGTCRYCFEPGTTSRDAPRKHRYRRRPSNDSVGGRSRVDKLSRYGSSEEDGHHKSSNRKSWLAAGLAAYVGKTLFDKRKNDRRDHSPSIRRTKSSSSSSVGGRGPASYGQTAISERSYPPSTIGGRQRFDRYESKSDVSKPSISGHSRSKPEGHQRRDRSSSSSSDGKSSHGMRSAAIAAGALGTAAAVSSMSHGRKEKKVRGNSRSRSPRKFRRRYSSSSSSSMVDISRPPTKKGLASFSTFFTAPSEKSRTRRTSPRKRQRNFFGLGSTYSSSDDADLAFGSGFLKSRAPKKGKGRKRDEDIDAKLIGLGATAAGLAATASIGNRRRQQGLIAVKDRKPNNRNQIAADDNWESVSDEFSSADSGLAYGGPSSRSRDSFTSDSGASKWRWRWGTSKKKRRQSPSYPYKNNANGRDSQASYPPPSSSFPSLPSMQNIDPIPAPEQSLVPFRNARNSSTGGPADLDTAKPMYISNSEATEVDQPKPVVPIPSPFYSQKEPEGEKIKHAFKEIAPAAAAAAAGAAVIGTADEYYNDHPLKDSVGNLPIDEHQTKDMPLTLVPSPESNHEHHDAKLPKDSVSNIGAERHRQKQIMPALPSSLPGKYDQGPVVDPSGDTSVVKPKKSRNYFDDSDIPAKKPERRRRGSSPVLDSYYSYITEVEIPKRSSTAKGVQFELTKEQQDKEQRQLELESEKARRYQRTEEPMSDPESWKPKPKRLHRSEERDISPPLPAETLEEPLDGKDTSSWGLPARVTIPVVAGAATVAAGHILKDKRREKEECSSYPESSDAGPSTTSRKRFNLPGGIIEEPRDIAEKPVPNPKTKPTYESYADYFAPPELRKSGGETVPEPTPTAQPGGPRFRVIEPRSGGLDRELLRDEPVKSTSLPWPVPHLNIIEPTPPHSRTSSLLGDASEPKERRVADPVVYVPEIPTVHHDKDDATADRDAHEIERHADIGHTASSGITLHDVAGAVKKPDEKDFEIAPPESDSREPEPSFEVPSPPHHMPGEFGDDIEFAATIAAGTAMSGFDPSIVTGNPAYYSRVSPPGSEDEGGLGGIHGQTPVSPARGFGERESLPPSNNDANQGSKYHGPLDRTIDTLSGITPDILPRDMETARPDSSSHGIPEDTTAKLGKKNKKKLKAAKKKGKTSGETPLEPDWEEESAYTQPQPTEVPREVEVDPVDEPTPMNRGLFDNEDKAGKGLHDMDLKGVVDEREEVPAHEPERWQDAEEDLTPPTVPSAFEANSGYAARNVEDHKLDNALRTSMPGNFDDVLAGDGTDNRGGMFFTPEKSLPTKKPEFTVPEKFKMPKGKKKRRTADETEPFTSETAEPNTRSVEIDEHPDHNAEDPALASLPESSRSLERGSSKSKRRSHQYSELIESQSDVAWPSKPEDNDSLIIPPRAKSETAKGYANSNEKSQELFGLIGSSAEKEEPVQERDQSPPPSEISSSKKKSKKNRRADDDEIKADENDLPTSQNIESVNPEGAAYGDQQRQKSKDRKKNRKSRYEQIVESGKASNNEDKNLHDISSAKQQIDESLDKSQSPRPFLEDSPEIPSVHDSISGQGSNITVEKALDNVPAPVSAFPLQLNLPSRCRSRSVTPLPGEKIVDLPTQSRSRPSSPSRSPPDTAKRVSWRGFNFGDLNSSPTAIPIQLRRPPSTPDRATHDGQVSPSRPRSGHKRPKSTEFKTSREFRPLWLVERHTSKAEHPVEESYPSLPSSKSTSRVSSTEDLRAKALDGVESTDLFSTPRRRPSLQIATDHSSHEVDILGSQQSTPTAHAFKHQEKGRKEKPKYEFHSPSELLRDPMLNMEMSKSALNDVPPSPEGTVIHDDDRKIGLDDIDLQNLPPLPESPIHEDLPVSGELDRATPDTGHGASTSSNNERVVELADASQKPAAIVSSEQLPSLPDSRPSSPSAGKEVEHDVLAEDIDRSLTPQPTHRRLDEVSNDIPMDIPVPDSAPVTPTQGSPTYRASEASEYGSVDEDHFVDASSQAPMSPSYQRDVDSPTTPTHPVMDYLPREANVIIPSTTELPAPVVPEAENISNDTDAESVMTVQKDDIFGKEPELDPMAEETQEPEAPEPSKSKKNKKKKKRDSDTEAISTAPPTELDVPADPISEPAPEPETEREPLIDNSIDPMSSTITDQAPAEEITISEESKAEPLKQEPAPEPAAKSKGKKGKSKKGRKNKIVADPVEEPRQKADEPSATIPTPSKEETAIIEDRVSEAPASETVNIERDDAVISSATDIHPQSQHDNQDIVDAVPDSLVEVARGLADDEPAGLVNPLDKQNNPTEPQPAEKEEGAGDPEYPTASVSEEGQQGHPQENEVTTQPFFSGEVDPVPMEALPEDIPLPPSDLNEIDALNPAQDQTQPATQVDDGSKEQAIRLPGSPLQNPQDLPLPEPSLDEADILEESGETETKQPMLRDNMNNTLPSIHPNDLAIEIDALHGATDVREIEPGNEELLNTTASPKPAIASPVDEGLPIGQDTRELQSPATTDAPGHSEVSEDKTNDAAGPAPSPTNQTYEKGDQSDPDVFFDTVQDVNAHAKHENLDELAGKEPEPTFADKPEEVAGSEPKQKKKKGKKGKKDRKNANSLENEASTSAEPSEVPVRFNDAEGAPAVASNEEIPEPPAIDEQPLEAEGARDLPLSTDAGANAAEAGEIANDSPPHIPGDSSSQFDQFDVRSASKQSKKQKKKDKKKQASANALGETVPEASTVEGDVENIALEVQDKTAVPKDIGEDQPIDKGENDLPGVGPDSVEEKSEDIPVDVSLEKGEPLKEDTLPIDAEREDSAQLEIDDGTSGEKDLNIVKGAEESETMQFKSPVDESGLQAEKFPSTEEVIKPAKSKKDKKGKKSKKNREALPGENEPEGAEPAKPAEEQPPKVLDNEPSITDDLPAEEQPLESQGDRSLNADNAPAETSVEKPLTAKEKKKKKKNRGALTADEETQLTEPCATPITPEDDAEPEDTGLPEANDEAKDTQPAEHLAEEPPSVDNLPTELEPLEASSEQVEGAHGISAELQTLEQVSEHPSGVDDWRTEPQYLEPSNELVSDDVDKTSMESQPLEASQNEQAPDDDKTVTEPQPLEPSNEQSLPIDDTLVGPQPSLHLTEEPLESPKDPQALETSVEKPADSYNISKEASLDKPLPVKEKKKKKKKNRSQSLDDGSQAVEAPVPLEETPAEEPQQDKPAELEKDTPTGPPDDKPSEPSEAKAAEDQPDAPVEPLEDKLPSIDNAVAEIPVEAPLTAKEKRKKKKKKGQSLSVDDGPQAIETPEPLDNSPAGPLENKPMESERDTESQEPLSTDRLPEPRQGEPSESQDNTPHATEVPSHIEVSPAESPEDNPSDSQPYEAIELGEIKQDPNLPESQVYGSTELVEEKQPESQQSLDLETKQDEPTTLVEDKLPETHKIQGSAPQEYDPAQPLDNKQSESYPFELHESKPIESTGERQPETDTPEPQPIEPTEEKQPELAAPELQENGPVEFSDEKQSGPQQEKALGEQEGEQPEPQANKSSETREHESADLVDDNQLKSQADKPPESLEGELVENLGDKAIDPVDGAPAEPSTNMTPSLKEKKKKKKKKGQSKTLEDDEPEAVDTPTPVEEPPTGSMDDQSTLETPTAKPLTAKEKKKQKKREKQLSLYEESQSITTSDAPKTFPIETPKDQALEIDTHPVENPVEEPSIGKEAEMNQDPLPLEDVSEPKEAVHPSESLPVESLGEEAVGIDTVMEEPSPETPLSAKEKKKKKKNEKKPTPLEHEPEPSKEVPPPSESILDEAFGTDSISVEASTEKPLSAKEKKKKKRNQEPQPWESESQPVKAPLDPDNIDVTPLSQEASGVDNASAETPFEQPLIVKEKKAKKGKKLKQPMDWTEEVPQDTEISGEKTQPEIPIPTGGAVAPETMSSSIEPVQEDIEKQPEDQVGPSIEPSSISQGTADIDIDRGDSTTVTGPEEAGGENKISNPDEDGKDFQLSISKKSKSKKKAKDSGWTDVITPTQVDNGPAIPPTEFESQQRSLSINEEPPKEFDATPDTTDALLRNDSSNNPPDATELDLAVSKPKPSDPPTDVDVYPEDVIATADEPVSAPIDETANPELIPLPESMETGTEQIVALEETGQEGIETPKEVECTGPGQSLDDQNKEHIQESAAENPAEPLPNESKDLSPVGLGDALDESSVPEPQDQSISIPLPPTLPTEQELEDNPEALTGAKGSVEDTCPESIIQRETQEMQNETPTSTSETIYFASSTKPYEQQSTKLPQAARIDIVLDTADKPPTEVPNTDADLPLDPAENPIPNVHDSSAAPLDGHLIGDAPISSAPEPEMVIDELPTQHVGKSSKKKKKKKDVVLEQEPEVAPEAPEGNVVNLPEEHNVPEPTAAETEEKPLRALSKKEQKAAKKKARKAAIDVLEEDSGKGTEEPSPTPGVLDATAGMVEDINIYRSVDAQMTEKQDEAATGEEYEMEEQPISTVVAADSIERDIPSRPTSTSQENSSALPEAPVAMATTKDQAAWGEVSGSTKKSKKQKKRGKGMVTASTEPGAGDDMKEIEPGKEENKEEIVLEPAVPEQSSKKNKKKKKKNIDSLDGEAKSSAAEEKKDTEKPVESPVCPEVDMSVAGEVAAQKEDEVWPTIDWDHIHEHVSNTIPYAQVDNEREVDTASLDLQLSGDHEVTNDTPEIQQSELPDTMTADIGDFSEDTMPKGEQNLEDKPVEMAPEETELALETVDPGKLKDTNDFRPVVEDSQVTPETNNTPKEPHNEPEEVRREPDQVAFSGDATQTEVVPEKSEDISEFVPDSAMDIDDAPKDPSQDHGVVMEDSTRDISMEDSITPPPKQMTADASESNDLAPVFPVDATQPVEFGPAKEQRTEDVSIGNEPGPEPTAKTGMETPTEVPIGSTQEEETSSKEAKGRKGKKGKKLKGKGKDIEEDKSETPLLQMEEFQDPSNVRPQDVAERAEPSPEFLSKQLEVENVPVPTTSEIGERAKAKGRAVGDIEWTGSAGQDSQEITSAQGAHENLLDKPEIVPEEPPQEAKDVLPATGKKENKSKDKKKDKAMAVETEQPQDLPLPLTSVEPEAPIETMEPVTEAPKDKMPEQEEEFLPNVTKRKGKKKSKDKGKRLEPSVETEKNPPDASREPPVEPEEPVKSDDPALAIPKEPQSGPEDDLPALVVSKRVNKNKRKNKAQVLECPSPDNTEAQLPTPQPEPVTEAAMETLEVPDWSQQNEFSLGDISSSAREEMTTTRGLDTPAQGPSGTEMKLNKPTKDVEMLDRSIDEAEATAPAPKCPDNDDPFSVESSTKERSSSILFHSSPSTRDIGYMTTPARHAMEDEEPEERPSTPTPNRRYKPIETDDEPLDDVATHHALLPTPEKETIEPAMAEGTTSKSPEQARPPLEPPSLFGGPYGLAERGRSASRSASPPKTPLGTIKEHSTISPPYANPLSPAIPQPTPDTATTVRGPEKKKPAQQPARTASDVDIIRSPESTPPKLLRRVKSSRSTDLKAAGQRDLRRGRTRTPSPSLQQAEEDEEARQLPSSSTYDPVTDKGKAPLRGMAADVYEGWGDVQGAPPLSPTRPPSVRRRRSLQRLQELETRLDQLVSENRLLGSSKAAAERAIESHAVAQRQHARALEARDQTIQNKELEIQQLQKSSDWLKKEIARLTEANEGLAAANASYAASRGLDGGDNSNYKKEWEKSQQELEKVRAQYAQLSSSLEQMVKHEVGTALADKDAEIQLLRDNLADAQHKIKELQQQIQAASKDDILVFHDEDYFDNACQKLCQHVQQWVLRFSKFSDMRVCRTTGVLRDEKIVDRFENAILDGTDVDTYLSDRVRRRDVFMSVAMTMMWEYIFTRYLFGMDREQRQKLKTLEKHLAEVGPPNAVHKWRATTLTLLSKRPSFKELRAQDTEAVVQEIYRTLSKLLPPPHELEKTVLDSLRNVMRSAVDLSIKMRTQRAEYIMLPPLQPEYDTNGELLRKVYFNAALMNERSGETTSNEELEAQRAVVRMVLFPLVVKKGSDEGDGDEEIVVCPAQVLVARPPKDRKSSKGLSADRQSVRSVQSFPSISMDPSNPSNII